MGASRSSSGVQLTSAAVFFVSTMGDSPTTVSVSATDDTAISRSMVSANPDVDPHVGQGDGLEAG